MHNMTTRLLTRAPKVLEGGQVVDRTGAVGKLRSVYCRDPDGNLVEYALVFLQVSQHQRLTFHNRVSNYT